MVTSPNAQLLLDEVADWLVRSGHEVTKSADPASRERRLTVYLEPERQGWPREYLDVRIRGGMFFVWHVTHSSRQLIDTHVTQRTFRFINWMLKQLERGAPWPKK